MEAGDWLKFCCLVSQFRTANLRYGLTARRLEISDAPSIKSRGGFGTLISLLS